MVGPEVVSPVLVRKVNPLYPELARKMRIQGIVLMQAVIGIDGEVQDIDVLSSPHKMLTDAAIDALHEWRYRPATIKGKPVRCYLKVTVRFSLT